MSKICPVTPYRVSLDADNSGRWSIVDITCAIVVAYFSTEKDAMDACQAMNDAFRDGWEAHYDAMREFFGIRG